MKKIAPDKWKHFYVGIIMGALLQAFFWYYMPAHILLGIIISFIIIIIISYGFELFSLITGKGHYEIMDAVAAIIGGVLGMGLLLLIEFILMNYLKRL
ncbi:MAG TPA: hypothetical protein VGO09_05695 [Flavisolibacter sp.]|nr:hypothetical protein [Flavisolibacter sp.]